MKTIIVTGHIAGDSPITKSVLADDSTEAEQVFEHWLMTETGASEVFIDHWIELDDLMSSTLTPSKKEIAFTVSAPQAEAKRLYISSIKDVDMTDLFDYDTPDDLPEWEWVEANSSYSCKHNNSSGVWDFIVNLSRELTDIPTSLVETIESAKADNCSYILFNQGT